MLIQIYKYERSYSIFLLQKTDGLKKKAQIQHFIMVNNAIVKIQSTASPVPLVYCKLRVCRVFT